LDPSFFSDVRGEDAFLYVDLCARRCTKSCQKAIERHEGPQ
jgi:hypothetical protein